MAFLYDHTVEEITASTWKKVTIGVLLTLIFHLGDALLGGHLAKNYKINALEIGKVNHLPFCFYKMAKPPHSPIIRHLPFRFCEMARHCIRLGRMMGECGALPLACQWKMANAKTIVA